MYRFRQVGWADLTVIHLAVFYVILAMRPEFRLSDIELSLESNCSKYGILRSRFKNKNRGGMVGLYVAGQLTTMKLDAGWPTFLTFAIRSQLVFNSSGRLMK